MVVPGAEGRAKRKLELDRGRTSAGESKLIVGQDSDDGCMSV